VSVTLEYLDELKKLLDNIRSQKEAIEQAAELIKETFIAGGIVHLFGSGHSHIPAEEVMGRAGTLTFANTICPEKTVGMFERVPGTGEFLLAKQDVRPGEVIFVFSNSGINPLPVELAQEAKARGLKVVAITAMEHTEKAKPRTVDGKRLFEVADVVIDNCAPYGDAVLTLPGSEIKFAPVSTIAAVAVINAVFAEAAAKIAAAGLDAPVRISRNTPGGTEHNKKFIAMYADRIPGLRF
jgi:uncharacterized phosphosugar-binding protein